MSESPSSPASESEGTSTTSSGSPSPASTPLTAYQTVFSLDNPPYDDPYVKAYLVMLGTPDHARLSWWHGRQPTTDEEEAEAAKTEAAVHAGLAVLRAAREKGVGLFLPTHGPAPASTWAEHDWVAAARYPERPAESAAADAHEAFEPSPFGMAATAFRSGMMRTNVIFRIDTGFRPDLAGVQPQDSGWPHMVRRIYECASNPLEALANAALAELFPNLDASDVVQLPHYALPNMEELRVLVDLNRSDRYRVLY